MAKGDFLKSLGSFTPQGAAVEAVSGLAAGGPSSSGDISGPSVDFGSVALRGGAAGGAGLLPPWAIPVGIALAVVAVASIVLRR